MGGLIYLSAIGIRVFISKPVLKREIAGAILDGFKGRWRVLKMSGCCWCGVKRVPDLNQKLYIEGGWGSNPLKLQISLGKNGGDLNWSKNDRSFSEKCSLSIDFTSSPSIQIPCIMVRTHLSGWNILGFLLRACKSIFKLITTRYKHLQHNSKLFSSIIIDGRGTPTG